MRISDRLWAMYRAVKQGETVADIGTDHGYVPILLLRHQVSPRVIVSDISESSLAKARENFGMQGIILPEKDYRVGDGFRPIAPGEVDDLMIGGLGGQTILHILSEDMEKLRSYRRLILQPRNNCGELRCFLYAHGYDIVNEALAEEGKFICEIITAVRSEEAHREIPYSADDIRWRYPERLVTCDLDLLKQRIDWKVGRLDEQIESLEKSQNDPSERIELLRAQQRYLRQLLERSRASHG